MWQEIFTSIWIWKKEMGMEEETDFAPKLMSIQNRFLEQEGRLKGLLTHRGNRLANAPKGSHLWGSSLTTELRVFWKISRPETRKIEIGYKIVYFNKMLNVINANFRNRNGWSSILR